MARIIGPAAAALPVGRPLFVIGAGGHASVVIDACRRLGLGLEQLRLRDAVPGMRVFDLLAEVPEVTPAIAGHGFHVAVGNTASRERLHGLALAAGAEPWTVIHPAAVIAESAAIGGGSLVAALALVAPRAAIGSATIINHGAIVEHDCAVGDFAHIAPRATLGGGARVGDRCLIGAGAVVLPGVSIGAGTIVGAGAVITADVSGGTWVGVPAHRVGQQ